jgi:hypothetical protein
MKLQRGMRPNMEGIESDDMDLRMVEVVDLVSLMMIWGARDVIRLLTRVGRKS